MSSFSRVIAPRSEQPASEPPMQPKAPETPAERSDIRIKGKTLSVPAVQIDGRTVVSTGKWLKMAAVREEELVEGPTISDLASFIDQLKQSGLKADIFTFAQRLPDITPKYSHHIEWDNAAAIPITTFAGWWKEVEYSIRKAVNKSKKSGVLVKRVDFSDEFVAATH